jgi:hypothetical protein
MRWQGQVRRAKRFRFLNAEELGTNFPMTPLLSDSDVLHDEWRAISLEDVEAAHHYVQRILEDFYDDRESVLAQLRKAKRVPSEDKTK